MLVKYTKKLFKNTYQYKVVLVCAGAGYFRNGNMDYTMSLLKGIDLGGIPVHHMRHQKFIRSKEDLDNAIELCKILKKLSDIEVRVESPWITIYTNNKNDVDKLTVNPSRVKYISIPDDSSTLDPGTVIMPKIDFDYKVTVSKTTREQTSFVEWAKNNPKIRITKRCIADLSRPISWGGSYFYVKGEKNLLVAKMHLSDAISKIERVVKA